MNTISNEELVSFTVVTIAKLPITEWAQTCPSFWESCILTEKQRVSWYLNCWCPWTAWAWLSEGLGTYKKILWSLGVSKDQTIPGSYINSVFMDNLWFVFYFFFLILTGTHTENLQTSFFWGRWCLGNSWREEYRLIWVSVVFAAITYLKERADLKNLDFSQDLFMLWLLLWSQTKEQDLFEWLCTSSLHLLVTYSIHIQHNKWEFLATAKKKDFKKFKICKHTLQRHLALEL